MDVPNTEWQTRRTPPDTPSPAAFFMVCAFFVFWALGLLVLSSPPHSGKPTVLTAVTAPPPPTVDTPLPRRPSENLTATEAVANHENGTYESLCDPRTGDGQSILGKELCGGRNMNMSNV